MQGLLTQALLKPYQAVIAVQLMTKIKQKVAKSRDLDLEEAFRNFNNSIAKEQQNPLNTRIDSLIGKRVDLLI